jgi:hypothetical protein
MRTRRVRFNGGRAASGRGFGMVGSTSGPFESSLSLGQRPAVSANFKKIREISIDDPNCLGHGQHQEDTGRRRAAASADPGSTGLCCPSGTDGSCRGFIIDVDARLEEEVIPDIVGFIGFREFRFDSDEGADTKAASEIQVGARFNL